MYIKRLQRNKKSRKSLNFKRRIVEVYRAEIAQPADIQRYLHISLTELRRLNRCGAARAVFQTPISPSFIPLSLLQNHEKTQANGLSESA